MHTATNNPSLPPRPGGGRRRGWRTYSVTGVIGLAALAGQCAPPQCAPAPAPATTLAPALQQVVDLTNAERAALGLPRLTVDARLNAAAQAHSEDQAAMDKMTHIGSDSSRAGERITRQGYTFQEWAENVAMGYPDARSVMDGWMNSPSHERNIVSTSVTQIGVGLAYSAGGTPYWTQVFAAPG